MSKSITININVQVKFKLTNHGKEVLEKWFKNLNIKCTQKPDEYGYYTMQLWEVMCYFGQDTYMGAKQIILKNKFIFLEMN